jgi:prepilin-type N-terminal cleavage/methylation domain-containing protein
MRPTERAVRESSGTLDQPAAHRGFSLVELLVVICILSILAALLLPAIDRVRETARAAVCRNRLRSLALATLQFEGVRGCFPPARIISPVGSGTAAGTPSATWLVRVMPFLEQAVAPAWDDAKPYAEQSDAARSLVVADYLCPTRRATGRTVTASTMTPNRLASCGCLIPGRPVSGGAVADFGGNHGHMVPSASGTSASGSGLIVSAEHLPGTGRWFPSVRPQDARDGLSRTLLVAEMHVPRAGLCEPPDNGPAYDATDFFSMSRVGGPGVPLADGPDDDVAGMGMFAFGGWHPGACQAAYGDGRIESLSPQMETDVLAALCSRADVTR